MSTSEEVRAVRQEEFFGVAPNCLVDDIYNAVDDFISDAVDSLECHVAKEMRIGEEGPRRRTLTQGADKLLMHMREACELNFDKFELYVLRNIFSLPDDLELPSQSPVGQLSLADADQHDTRVTQDNSQSPNMNSTSENTSDPNRFFSDIKELDCELAVLLGRLKTESSKRNQYTKTLRDLKDTLTCAQSHVDSDALAALDPKKVRVVIEAAANMRAAANRLQDIQRGMGRSSGSTMPEEWTGMRGNNNNIKSTSLASTAGSGFEEQHVSAGETLAHEMKELQGSFGSPSVEVLRNLMECL